jgi:hypothetical protein
MPLACLADDAEAPGFVESVLEQAAMPAATRIEHPKTSAFKKFLSIVSPYFLLRPLNPSLFTAHRSKNHRRPNSFNASVK